MPSDPELSVLVPCYNDERNLPPLLKRLGKVCSGLGVGYEVIFVDDGSADGTWRVVTELAANDRSVRGIRFTRNHGHQVAVSAALAAARGRRVLIIDSDLEDPPELLGEMMAKMDAGADNVYGVRLSRKGVPAWKRAGYKIFYRCLSFLAGCRIPEDSGDFRLISRRVVDDVNSMPECHRFLRGMISWLGYPSAPMPYHREARHSGVSGYTLKKLFLFAVDGITSFSIMPLRLATLLGLVMSVAVVCGVLYVLVSVLLFGAAVSGWASLMIVILLIGSVQLLVLGMLGEYLGRMFLETKRRPLFVVEAVAGEPAPFCGRAGLPAAGHPGKPSCG